MAATLPKARRDELTAAHDDLLAEEQAIASARQHIDGLEQRRAALARQRSELERDCPPEKLPPSADLVQALLADPTTEIDPSALGEEAQRQALHQTNRHAWTARDSVIASAILEIEQQIDQAREELPLAERDRAKAFKSFVGVAHRYQLDLFAVRFNELREEVLDYVLAFEDVGDMGSGARPRLSPASFVRIDRRENYIDGVTRSAGRDADQTLLEVGARPATKAYDLVDRFRADLSPPKS